jgi:hypothetical protein
MVETPLESNGPAEKPCLRRLRAVGKQWKQTKDSEHGGETLSHVPIMPPDHKLSMKLRSQKGFGEKTEGGMEAKFARCAGLGVTTDNIAHRFVATTTLVAQVTCKSRRQA